MSLRLRWNILSFSFAEPPNIFEKSGVESWGGGAFCRRSMNQ